VLTATVVPVLNGPLTSECRQELSLANGRAKKIRKACSVAAFNGWVTAIFAACSAPFALFGIDGFVVTVGLILVAYNEFQGRKQLLQFNPAAASRLGWNQVGFLVLIVLYCVWMMFTGLSGDGPFAAELAAKPELAEALGSLDEFDALYRFLVILIYGTVIVLSVIFQGLNAFYYFTRRKHVEAYLAATPEWVLEVQRLNE
jgi:hypothetical protein